MQIRRQLRMTWTALVLASAGAAHAGPPAAEHAVMGPVARQQTLKTAFAPDSGRSSPVASHGFLVSHARRIAPGHKPGLFLTSLSTGEEFRLPLQISKASTIRVQSSAVAVDGSVLVAGSYKPRERGRSAVNFVARVDRDGVKAVHDLQDYMPQRICAAPDGTFWTFGQEPSKEARVSPRGGDWNYFLLRQYSAAGVLQGSFLERSALPPRRLKYTADVPGSNWAFLRCGERSVGAYVGRGTRFFLWTEVNMATGQAYARSVRVLRKATISGLALLGERQVFASFNPGGLHQLVDVPGRPSRWTPVAAADGSRPELKLLGRDGGDLVHLRGERVTQRPIVYWSSVGAPPVGE